MDYVVVKCNYANVFNGIRSILLCNESQHSGIEIRSPNIVVLVIWCEELLA